MSCSESQTFVYLAYQDMYYLRLRKIENMSIYLKKKKKIEKKNNSKHFCVALHVHARDI